MTSTTANNTAALYANIRDDQEEDAFTPKEEQDQVLKEVKKQIETEAHYMKRALVCTHILFSQVFFLIFIRTKINWKKH